MGRPEEDDGNEWSCSWEAVRDAQQAAVLRATPAERLAWLEEAIALAHRSGALPRPRAQSGLPNYSVPPPPCDAGRTSPSIACTSASSGSEPVDPRL